MTRFSGMHLGAALAVAAMTAIGEPFDPVGGWRGGRSVRPHRDPPTPDIDGPCSYRPTGSKRSRRRKNAVGAKQGAAHDR